MKHEVCLAGTWTLRDETDRKEYRATVPGSALHTLVEEGVLPDPYFRRNEYAVREFLNRDFSFYREFEVSEDFLDHDHVELVCEGIDTLADISLNGQLAAHTDNMHRTWRIPARGLLKPGANQILVALHAAQAYVDGVLPRENREIHNIPVGTMAHSQYLRKAHCMFGWDWGPQLPDAGIFRDIRLEAWDELRIREVRFHQIHEQDAVRLQTGIVLEGAIPGAGADYRLKVRLLDAEKQTVGELCLNPERPEGELLITNPRLWWPHTMGQPTCYEAVVTLEKGDPEAEALQTLRYRLGLRTLTVRQRPDAWGNEFAFVVNGVDVFAMGADWIPEDAILPRVNLQRVERLLEDAVRANYNSIRVWGGGYYPSDEFYDLCDEKGLLVWQDLMFACHVYDASDAFLDNVRQEVLDNVTRLRHHPSLALWCGNNELESGWVNWESFLEESPYLKADYVRMFEHVIPQAVAEADPDTFFWPSSPSSGGCFDDPDADGRGDRHYWDVWHGQKPFTDYQNHYFRFVSEFGFQSFPCLKTVESFTLPEDRNIFSPVMESHQKNPAANGKLLYYLAETFRYPADFDDLLYLTQLLQGLAIRFGVEHWRRNRGRCMGAIYWQMNDNWPVASWASIDYFGRWKALHYMAKQFFRPLTASIFMENGRAALWIENETGQEEDWSARLTLRDTKGRILSGVGTGEALSGSCGARTSEEACSLEIPPMEKETDLEKLSRLYVEAKVTYRDGTVQRLSQPLVPFKSVELEKAEIQAQVEASREGYILKLKSPVWAPFVELSVEDADVVFDDNYFDLTDGEPVKVLLAREDIRSGEIADAADLERRLRIRSLGDVYGRK